MNVLNTIAALAHKFKSLYFGCACHGNNKIVEHCVYPMAELVEARKCIKDCAEHGCPQEINTRWIACFHGLEWIEKHQGNR